MATKWPVRRIVKYGVCSAVLASTAVTYNLNEQYFNHTGIMRIGRAARTVFDISANYQKNLYSEEARQMDPSSEEYNKLRSTVHKQAAEKLLQLCKENKGVYIKVGQHIGALEYLLPKEYCETMNVLHYNAPKSSLDEICEVLREDLNCEPSSLFSYIDPEPQGVASLAQVHKAILKNGELVALKVQHPHVLSNSLIDIKTMETLVSVTQWIFPDLKIQWLTDEMKKNLPLELNFLHEAENTEKVREMFASFPWLKIPNIYKEYSTKRVLMMEFCEGGHVTDVQYLKDNNISKTEVTDKLGHLYSRMIFNEGFVHSDPHPGNILVHKNDKGIVSLVLLDHGLYATLSDHVRWAYSKLWLSILNRNFQEMKIQCEKLGVGSMYALFSCMISGRTWDSIQSGISKVKYTSAEKEIFQKNGSEVVSSILVTLASVNCELLLILKTNDLIRGIEHKLETQSRNVAFLVMSKCCVNSVYNEKLQQCENLFARLYYVVEERWMILKLSLYYLYLNITGIFE